MNIAQGPEGRSQNNYGRFRTKLTEQECGSRTRDPDCKHNGVQPDRPVGHCRQPVRLCIVYDRRGDPRPGRKDPGRLHREDGVRGC